MNHFISISLIIGYFLILCISFITIIYIIKNRKRYGTEIIAYLNIGVVFTSGFIFYSCYLFSVVFFISNTINLILWKILVISGFLSLIITSFLYSFFKEYRKIQIIPVLMISIFFGLLIGTLFLPNSILISIHLPPSLPFSMIDVSTINYHFNFSTGAIVIIFQISITIYLLYISIYMNLKSEDLKESLPLFLNTSIFTAPVFFYILYIIFQDQVYRELFVILIWITNFGVNVMIILKPEMFFLLPNKIYSVNIYHKSGILLYSYNFKKKEKILNNLKIWGNIIIGLNHILSEFVDKSDKIDVIQTREADIVVDYDNEHGFAVVVLTSKKNAILERIIQKFSQEFKSFYKNELNEIQDLNRLINVSEFKNAQQIIEKNFELYL
ncbi:MAG: hypothetical protein ACFE8M_08475 [Candidatus Hermodarchaeota archaeon]